MAKFVTVLFIFLMVSGYQQIGKCKDEETSTLGTIAKYGGYAGNAFKFGMTVYDGVKKIYGILQPKTTQESESDQKLEPGMEQRITDQIKKVSKQISSLKIDMKNMKLEIIDKIVTELPDKLILRNHLYDIYLYINKIENLYLQFEDYVIQPQNFSIGTLESFAKAATTHSLLGLPNLLTTIHWMLVQTDSESGESILTMLSKNNQSPSQMCNRQQSLQQLIYALYDSIVTADIKGHTMIQYAYMLLETLTHEKKSTEIEQAKKHFATRISNTLQHVKKEMALASRVVWKCDNYGFKENITYTRFNNFVQRYMVNEADLNLKGYCNLECPNYSRTKVYDCYDKTICKEQRICNGDIWDCEFKTSGKMWVCPSDKNSNRRYEYIEYGNSQRYGPKGSCKNPVKEIDSWFRFPHECNYCTCTCDDVNYAESDRYVSLRSAYSDYGKQYVVTGVRLRKENHVLHLQIQQGELLPEGLIRESTVHWKSIEAFKINEPLPSTVGTGHERVPVEYGQYFVLKHKFYKKAPGVDPETIRKAAFNLDDLDFTEEQTDRNYVLVGVRFNYCTILDSGEHINLESFMAPFNFTTGKIDLDSQIRWYSKCRNAGGYHGLFFKSDKNEVKLQELDIPTEGARSIPTSQTNQFLYLKTSSMDTDAGQNTLPFLDIQDVETYPHVPLSGVGLFHKSSPGTGGFLSLKLFTYNCEPHFGVTDD